MRDQYLKLKKSLVEEPAVLAQSRRRVHTVCASYTCKAWRALDNREVASQMSILRRTGFVIRNGTKATKTLPKDFDGIKDNFVFKVQGMIDKDQTPETLVLNFDHTGCSIMPGGVWTMEEQGSALLTVPKSGRMLSPQPFYAGKTDRCHPKGVKFPKGLDPTCTESH
ncbi:hypothetical protein MAR_019570 [Mya arenaria]|uniref:Uncharacterized protein n=1 Tax=Mya arenaria TaxID=6604 RepID=A0ABY7E6L0_MYAAR|nr:hypothetical protein MAR_019570 [Mya arenaria]